VIELNWNGQEKRARRNTARPEPTIIGKCEGWNFIVGKKIKKRTRVTAQQGSLQLSNKKFIHSLFTNLGDDA
jgi:hypothetical protein